MIHKNLNIASYVHSNKSFLSFQYLKKIKQLLMLLGAMLWYIPSISAQCDTPLKGTDKAKMEEAITTYKNKKFASANTLFKKLAARNPKSADIQFYLGMIATKHTDNPAAIRRYFSKVIELCPEYNNALAHFYMAIIYYTDKKYSDAVAELNIFFDKTNNSQNPEYEAVYEEAANYLHWSQFLADAELNRAPFFPTAITGISSKNDELLPYFTWDKQQAYYIRIVPENIGKTYYARETIRKFPRMMVSTLKNGNYSTGEILPAPFNQHESEGSVTITSDNKTLYYSVMTPESNGYNNCDIYYSEFRGGVWTDIIPASNQINSPKSWDSQPSITPDGKYLYFASNRAGGIGGIDIWRCKRLPNGDWSRAENLGSRINTPGNEKCPFIHADGHTLYFASNGWQGFGGYDMYFINIQDNNAARPTNIGLPINTENDDIYFGVNIEGDKGYFAGKMPDFEGIGKQDVFRFDLYPAARPEQMRLIKGIVTDSTQKPLEAKIYIKRYGTEDAEYIAKSGEFSIALSCEETNVIVINHEGYMPLARVITPNNIKNGSNDTQTYKLQTLKLNARYPINGIKYNNNTKQLTIESKKILDVYVNFLQEHPMIHLSICSPNNAEARVVYNYLVSQRLRKERLSIGGGERMEFKIKQL